VLRFLANLVIMAGEIAAVAALAYGAYLHPFAFAAVTAVLALGLGVVLEHARLAFEVPFYFGEKRRPRLTLWLIAIGDSIMKALLAGLAALLTFAGTDRPRLWVMAILFGGVLYAGTNLLRWLNLDFDAKPERWGFFRLAAPLGLLFSLGGLLLADYGIVKVPTLGEIGRTFVFDMPARPSIELASEVAFNLRLYFDGLVTTLLSATLGAGVGKAVAMLISTNVLAGFVAALYAVLIAGAVRRLERLWL
jgi:hypothetical protein